MNWLFRVIHVAFYAKKIVTIFSGVLPGRLSLQLWYRPQTIDGTFLVYLPQCVSVLVDFPVDSGKNKIPNVK